MHRKTVILINGSGEKGKDTLIGFVAEKHLVTNISSIDPYKHIAYDLGWDGKKDEKGRKFLSSLKRISIEYNDYPAKYIVDEYRRFVLSHAVILFIHVREPEEIDKYKARIKEIHEHMDVKTLKIDKTFGTKFYGNLSDDNVDNYAYDFVYFNDFPLEETKDRFVEFIEQNVIAGKLDIITTEEVHNNKEKYGL